MSETLQAGAQTSQWEREMFDLEVGGEEKTMNNVSEE